MRINKTVHKANLDTALSNGTIKENDITFVRDKYNYEGIVIGNINNKLEFRTVPSFDLSDAGKILAININGNLEWVNPSVIMGSEDQSKIRFNINFSNKESVDKILNMIDKNIEITPYETTVYVNGTTSDRVYDDVESKIYVFKIQRLDLIDNKPSAPLLVMKIVTESDPIAYFDVNIEDGSMVESDE